MKIFRKIVLFLLSVFFLLALFGCQNKDSIQNINLDLSGAWITEDGTILSNCELTIRGELPADPVAGKRESCKLNFVWPESLYYMNSGMQELSVYFSDIDHATVPFCFTGYDSFYDPEQKLPVPLAFVIFPKEGLVLIRDSANNRYFAASTDPSTDPAQILATYRDQFFK